MKVPAKCVLVCSLLFASQLAAAQQDARSASWIATWTASPTAADPDPKEPVLNLEDQTVRERVRVSIGGARIRIRLSNEFGSSPLVVASVTVAVPSDPANVIPASIRTVTFGGRKSITIPAGAPALSDPVDFPIKPGAEISVSLYFPKRITTTTWHALALKRAVISPRGEHAGDRTHEEKIEGGTEFKNSVFLSAVLVPAEPHERLIVAFGDSITDGDGAVDKEHNWPSDLVRRILVQRIEGTREGQTLAVANEGISGNRVLSDGPLAFFGLSALARFERDALSVPGVTHIVLLEGINDIGLPGAKLGDLPLPASDEPTVEDLVGAYRQMIARAHARGLKLIGATILPCEGVIVPGYYTEAKERTRQAVNQWIRGGGEFDGVIDFDAVMRDPAHPSRLFPRFASKDNIHPNDAGYQAMADSVDLGLFK